MIKIKEINKITLPTGAKYMLADKQNRENLERLISFQEGEKIKIPDYQEFEELIEKVNHILELLENINSEIFDESGRKYQLLIRNGKLNFEEVTT